MLLNFLSIGYILLSLKPLPFDCLLCSNYSYILQHINLSVNHYSLINQISIYYTTTNLSINHLLRIVNSIYYTTIKLFVNTTIKTKNKGLSPLVLEFRSYCCPPLFHCYAHVFLKCFLFLFAPFAVLFLLDLFPVGLDFLVGCYSCE